MDPFQQKLDAAIVDHFTQLDSQGNFVHPPKTDDELWDFIRAAYGVRIPRKVVTNGHSSPFAFIADLYFERVKNALGFANRTGGKTFGVALLNHLDMTFKGGCEIASAGAVLDQANKCYRYLTGFLELPWYIRLKQRYLAITKRPWVTQTKVHLTILDNKSRLEIVTGTEKGLRGPHPHKARIDEIDEIEWSVLQTGLSMSHSAPGILGQNVFTSTRQKMHGSMQRMIDESSARGIKIYEWNVFEILEKCPRRCENDPVHGTCPILAFCQGKAHHSEGYYSIDDFIEKVRLIDRDNFETEWLNEKPSKERFVYPQFKRGKHVVDDNWLMKTYGVSKPSLSWMRLTGIDFGSSPGHPFVHLGVFRLPNGRGWLIYDEYYREQRLLRDHAKAILGKTCQRAGEVAFADHDAQDRLELRQYGINTKPARKGPDTVGVGIDHVKGLLSGFPPDEEPLLFVHESCKNTIYEFESYAWPVRADGRPDKSGRPIQENDHAMDCLRYILYSYHRSSGPKYATKQVRGI